MKSKEMFLFFEKNRIRDESHDLTALKLKADPEVTLLSTVRMCVCECACASVNGELKERPHSS